MWLPRYREVLLAKTQSQCPLTQFSCINNATMTSEKTGNIISFPEMPSAVVSANNNIAHPLKFFLFAHYT